MIARVIARTFLLLTGVLALPSALAAQAAANATGSPAPHTVTCTLRTAPLSPGETAFAQDNLPKAEALLRSEGTAPGVPGDRAHNLLLRTLLDEEKFDEAESNAKDWSTAQPANSWAAISFAEAEWRRGYVSEAYQAILKAANLDPCNPQTDMVLGELFRFSGLDARAKRNFDRAHTIDPIDPEITADWLRFQPRAARLQHISEELNSLAYLTDEQRRSLEEWKKSLSEAPGPNTCHLVGSVQSTSIPYAIVQDGPTAPATWGLDVAFNGKSRRLEIDTGAHGLLLTRSAANALHLDIQEHTTSRGIGDDGDVATNIARVKSIRIGALEFQDCSIGILQNNPRAMSASDGLIGGDVFSSFLLTLDFPGRTLKLDPLPARPASDDSKGPSLATDGSPEDRPVLDRYIDPTMKDWTKIFRSGHELILPVSLNAGPNRLFILDTGSALNLVSWQMARPFAKVSKGSDIQLLGISGEVKQTYTTGPLTLSFAGLSQQSNGLVGMDTHMLGRNTGVEIAGLLGTPILHQLTVQIDYRDDLVHFTYDPKRLHRCAPGIQIADCF